MRPRSVQRQPGILGAVMRVAGTVPPGGGAVVMGVGIVSIDLHLAGAEALSRVLLGIAAAAWVLLGLLLTGRLVGWVALAVSAVVLLAMLWQPIPLLRTGSARSPRTAGEPPES